jgi:predicted Zn-dependent protease
VITRRLLLIAAVLAGALVIYAQSNPLNSLFNVLTSGKQPTQTQTDTGQALAQGAKSLQNPGPVEQQTIGESLALQIVSRYGGLVRDPTIMRRVNLIGRSMARYSDTPYLPWRFGVLNSPTVNGFSAPYGFVFITRGLYDLARSDDALAGVLAHEIAHVSRHHAETVLKAAEFGAAVGNFVLARSGNARTAQPFMEQLNAGIDHLGSTLFEHGYSPDTEYEADHVGHDLAKTCGYAGGGLRSVLVALHQRTGDSKQAFPTHPPLSDRIRRLPDEPAPPL